MQLFLPVSIGEALDKLTILDIKQIYIKQSDRLVEVKKEYDAFSNHIKQYVEKAKYQYELLKEINTYLWNTLDKQRDKTITDEQYNKISRDIVTQNDARFRTKDKINN